MKYLLLLLLLSGCTVACYEAHDEHARVQGCFISGLPLQPSGMPK